MDGDAREKPGHDRNRQKIGHPARPKHAGQHQNQADQQSERRGEFAIIRQANGSQQRQRAREDRHDRGIRARREKAVRAKRREGGRAGDKGEKADIGRKAAEARGGHLGGDGDGREREAGDEIEANGAEPNALKRTEQRPLFFFVVVHRSRFALIHQRFTLPLRGRVARQARGGVRQRPNLGCHPTPNRFAVRSSPLKGRVSPLRSITPAICPIRARRYSLLAFTSILNSAGSGVRFWSMLNSDSRVS